MKLKIQPAFLFYLTLIAVVSSWQRCLCVLTALFVHELGHICIGKLLREPFDALILTPFGGVITCSAGNTLSKGFKGAAIAAAGPVSNYALILIVSWLASEIHLNSDALVSLIRANLTMLLINMLPALPLDGGNLLFSLGYFVFPVTKLVSVLTGIGKGIGLLFALSGMYGGIRYGVVNCSLLLFSGYLIVYAGKARTQLLVQNTQTILVEKLESHIQTQPLRMYQVLPDTQVYTLIEYLAGSGSAAFLCESSSGTCIIHEKRLCRTMLSNPLARISELIQK